MKAPREILLGRHQAISSKLDAIRNSTVAAVCDHRASANESHERRSQSAATKTSGSASLVTWLLGCFSKLWLELIWRSRRIWAGLAAIWILIFILNVSQRDRVQMSFAKSSPPAEMMMTFRDQQKLLNELFADRSLSMDVERPRIYLPKPRTETMELLTA